MKQAKDGTEAKSGVYAVATVARAFTILDAFADGATELALRDIIGRTGLHKATAFRFLSALADIGFIHKDSRTGAYSLGFRLVRLGELAKAQNIAVKAAVPAMQSLRDRIDETVYLSVRVDDYRVYVEQAESRQDVRRVARLGDRKPLYFGSAGRIFMMEMSDDELDAYFSRTVMSKQSEFTIADPKSIRRELANIRKRGGIAEGGDESGTGGSSVSGAIYGPDGKIAAAMSISIPAFRCTPTVRKKAATMLREAIDRATDSLEAKGGRKATTRIPLRGVRQNSTRP